MTATARTDLRPVEALLVDMDGTLLDAHGTIPAAFRPASSSSSV